MEPEESVLVLASRCLYYLSFTIFEERPNTFCCGEDPHDRRCETRGFWELPLNVHDHHAFLIYGAMHWVERFRLARSEQELTELWYSFCDEESRRFTTWYKFWFEEERDSSSRDLPSLIQSSALRHDAIVKTATIVKTVTWGQRRGRFPKQKGGITPLISAARYGHEHAVSPLIKAGALLEAHNNELDDPFGSCCKVWTRTCS